MTDSQHAAATGIDVAVEEMEAWERRLTITVDADRVARTRDRIRQELGSRLDLRGFRKGHVPGEIVEQRYGPAVDERTVQELVDQAYRVAVENADLQPIGEPRVGNVSYDRGASLTFQVQVEIMPALRLDRVGGFQVERPEVGVTEDEVGRVVERLRGERGTWRPVEADRRPGDDDLVSVRIGPADREEPLDDSDRYRFELGEGHALPDIEAAIRELTVGESGEFDVAYPEDFENEELAGTTRRLRIELVGLKARELPPLDDAFAADVGDFETLEGLRDAVREDLRRHEEKEAEEAVRNQLVDGIIEANPFQVPETMLERYLDRVLDAPDGAHPEEVRAARQRFRPAAERQVKRHLILDHLVAREGLEATEEEVEARVRDIAERRGVEPGHVRRDLAREDRLDELRRELEVEKVFDYLKAESGVR